MLLHTHPLDSNKLRDLKPWTHYRDKKENRLLLIVDISLTNVILMEVKEYEPGQERSFNPIEIGKFQKMIDRKTRLEPYTPKV